MIDDVSITEYHLCCECKYSIDEPDEKGWKTGCLTRGKPNPNGGPCECDYFEGA